MRPSRHPRRLFGLVVAAGLSAGVPSPAAGADPIELPGDTIMAVAADLDGDGAREVVQMVRPSPDAITLETWRYHSGRWDPLGAADVPATPERSPAVGMLRVRVEDRDRVILVTAQPLPDDQFGRTCCLSMAMVGEERGRIRFDPASVDSLDRDASALQAIDFDGDGTDELVTVRTTLDLRGSVQTSHLEVHAWRGGGYVQVGATSLAGIVNGIVPGETDGIAGPELLHGPDRSGLIRRLALVDGELRVEDGQLRNFDGYVVGIAGGLIILGDGAGIRTVSWAPGGMPREVGRLDLGENPWIDVVGEGTDALLVNLRGSPQGDGDLRIGIFDLELRQAAEVSAPPAAKAIWRFLDDGVEGASFDVYPYPYLGPLPSELAGGRAAFSGGGFVIVQDGEGGFESRSMSALAGLSPIGTAGPDDGWLAVFNGGWSGPPNAVDLGGGSASTLSSAPLMLLQVDDLWEPEQSLPASVELVSAAFDADGEHLLSGPDGFAAVLDAPPGTQVLANGPQPESLEVGAVPLRVVFTHPGADEESNSDFAYGLMAVLPDGRALIQEWHGTVVREPPSLDATSTTRTFELGARVAGSVSPYAELVVDGRPVEVGADGAFEVSIDAPPWPVDVAVVARDPLGNETSEVVQVIGFVDYRGLPWLPIIGLLTAVVGVFALLRVPRRRAGPAPAWSGDGTLEEIELE